MMSGTMSASMVINNILVASEFIIPDRMEQLKLILYMNLCDYTFIKNEDSTAIVKATMIRLRFCTIGRISLS